MIFLNCLLKSVNKGYVNINTGILNLREAKRSKYNKRICIILILEIKEIIE